MEEKVKNRAWVKDAAIIFLAVLLVLTFFSSTIMNRSLTEAATQEIKSGSITAKVRGKGLVVANGENKVKANGTVTIAKVMVKAGDEVKTDDVLFVLGAGDSDELTAAKETLEDLELSYQQAMYNMPMGSNYTSEYNAIERARKDIAEAERVMNLQAELYEKALSESETEDISGRGLQELVDIQNEAMRELQGIMGQRDSVQLTVDSFYASYEQAKAYYEALVEQKILEHSGEEGYDPETEPDVIAAKEAMNMALNEAEKAKSDNQQTIADYNTQIAGLNAKLDAITQKIEQIRYGTSTTSATEEELQKYLSAKRDYEDACADYEELIAALEYSQAMDYRSANSAYLSAQAIQIKIDRQKELIKELAGEGEDNTIVAQTAGIISEVNCASGDSVVKGDILAVIEVPDMGYTISFSVTNDQARRLKVGDKATISNFYWGNEITATLKSIATDKKNPSHKSSLPLTLKAMLPPARSLPFPWDRKARTMTM